MQVTFNPKDTNTFASASLDRTASRCGALGSPPRTSPWRATRRAVNAVDYFTGGELLQHPFCS